MKRLRPAGPAVAVVLVTLTALSSSCSYTTMARAPSRAELWIDDELAGEATPGGAEVSVPVSYADPAWFLYVDEDDRAEASGVLARTRLDPLLTSSLCAVSALTTPACMLAGLLSSNPILCVGCLAPLGDVFLQSGVNAISTTADNASWLTIPAVAGCALLGLAPLVLLPFALRVPEEIELPIDPLLPPAAPASPAPSPAAPSAPAPSPSPQVSY